MKPQRIQNAARKLFFTFIYSGKIHREASSLFHECPDHIHTWKLYNSLTFCH